jgi:hypothetical protein
MSEMVVELVPGKVFQEEELVDNDKLNQLGAPTVSIDGATSREQVGVHPYFFALDTGAANALVAEVTPEFEVLENGMRFYLVVKADNTTASTLNVNSTGARHVVLPGDIALAGGELKAGQVILVVWLEALDKYVLLGGSVRIRAVQGEAGAWFYATGGGTADAQTVTLNPSALAYVAGMVVRWKAPAAVTGAATLNVNGLGAKALKKFTAAGKADLAARDIVTDQIVEAVYDGVEFVVSRIAYVTPTVARAAENLVAQTASGGASATTVLVTADWLLVEDTGGQGRRLADVNLSVAITASGVNGLDTGAEAANTWYYVWVIFNPATGTVAGLLSASATNPTMPAGYSHKALVSVVRNNSGSNFVGFYQTGREVTFAGQIVFSGKAPAAGGTYEALAGADLAAFQGIVPPIAKSVSGYLASVDGTAPTGIHAAIAADASGMGEQRVMAAGAVGVTMEGIYAAGVFAAVPLKTAQQIWWKAIDTVARNRLVVSGYRI